MSNIAALIRTATPSAIDASVEADLIVAAQSGEEAATLSLITQYAPAARNALARFRDVLDEDDAVQEVAVALLDLIATHDTTKSPRMAGRVAARLAAHLAEAANTASNGWGVPSRTMDRFYGILRKADGDVAEGSRICTDYEMTRETFLAVASALRSTESLTLATAHGEERETATYALNGSNVNAYAEVEDVLLADYLLEQVTDEERVVTRAAYGFDVVEVDGQVVSPEGSAPVSDALVGASLGVSRPKVQRLRAGALKTMRASLALDA